MINFRSKYKHLSQYNTWIINEFTKEMTQLTNFYSHGLIYQLSHDELQ